MLGADGALYGVRAPPRPSPAASIYRAAIDGSAISTLYQIDAGGGVQPAAGLTLGSDGMFYGTTSFGRVTEASTTPARCFRLVADGHRLHGDSPLCGRDGQRTRTSTR